MKRFLQPLFLFQHDSARRPSHAAVCKIQPPKLQKSNLHASLSPHLTGKVKACRLQVLLYKRTNLHIPDMRLRHSIQIHASEQTGKAVEILILAPASDRPLKYLNRQFIFPIPQIRRQFKIRRCKRILAVAHIHAVQPDRKPALRSLKRDEHALPQKILRQCEIFHIACYRIELLWHFLRPDFLPAVPRVLGVGILRPIVALHLNMRRDANVRPRSAIIIILLKTGNCLRIISRIMEFPRSV